MKFWWGFSEEKVYEKMTATFTNPVKPGVYKSRALGFPVHKIFMVGAKYLWILNMKLASYNLSSACNFDAAPRIFIYFILFLLFFLFFVAPVLKRIDVCILQLFLS